MSAGLTLTNKVEELNQMDSTSEAKTLWEQSTILNEDVWLFEYHFSDKINNALFKANESTNNLSSAMAIGRFLSENPEIDLDEVEIIKVNYENYEQDDESDVVGSSFYIFKTESGKIGIVGEYGTGETGSTQDGALTLQEEGLKPVEIKLVEDSILISVEGKQPQEAEIEYVQESNVSFFRARIEAAKKLIEQQRKVHVPDMIVAHTEKMLQERRLELKKIEDRISNRKEKVLQDLMSQDKILQQKIGVAIEMEENQKNENAKSTQKLQGE